MRLISKLFFILLLGISSLLKAQNEVPCTAPESHDFDYMLGEWQVYQQDTLIAFSTFSKEFNNCTVQEFYREPRKNYFRNSDATYNTTKKAWELCTYDNQGEYYIFQGNYASKTIQLTSTKVLSGTKNILVKLVYSNIQENSFVREIKISMDSAKTFITFNKLNYKRIMISPINGKKIYKEIIVKASTSEVYERWTQKSGIIKFLAKDCYVIMEPGGPYEIYFMPDEAKGFKGSEGCKVLSFIENKMLSFTWNAPPEFPTVRNLKEKAWVVIELEKIDDEHTKVKLTHTGFRDGEEWNKVYTYFDNTWGKVLEWLRDSF
ncbi:MAG: SRPBCC domain-containing protein [Bacteroidota bacterium]